MILCAAAPLRGRRPSELTAARHDRHRKHLDICDMMCLYALILSYNCSFNL